jgi:hypothetical protein
MALDYRNSHRLLTHPLTLFLSVWCFVVLLYMMHLSALLQFKNSLLLNTVCYIIVPFIGAFFVAKFALPRTPKKQVVSISNRSILGLDRRLRHWFVVWSCISLFEIIYSGGLPLFWLLTGSSKTYFDFGIHSLHGFANSLLLSLGLCSFALFAITRSRRYLYIPLFVFAWSVLVLARSTMMVFAIESAVVWEMIRGFRRVHLIPAAATFVVVIRRQSIT